MHLCHICRTRHRSEWDSNPRTRGMDPLLYHLAIPLCGGCLSSARRVEDRSRRFAGSGHLLTAPFFKQDTVFYHAGFEPASPRLTAACFPLKRMDRFFLLSVSFSPSKHDLCKSVSRRKHCCCSCFFAADLWTADIKYQQTTPFSWKKSCELSFFEESPQKNGDAPRSGSGCVIAFAFKRCVSSERGTKRFRLCNSLRIQMPRSFPFQSRKLTS